MYFLEARRTACETRVMRRQNGDAVLLKCGGYLVDVYCFTYYQLDKR